MDIPEFREWVDREFTRLSTEYRVQLNAVVNTCRQYAEGSAWEDRHTTTGISCLPAPPSIGKYPGEVSEEDKAWYRTCLKPDWKDMRNEAEKEIRKLCAGSNPA